MNIHDLHRQGLGIRAIARRAGLDRKTVRKYLARGVEPPAYGPRTPRGRILELSLPIILFGVENCDFVVRSRVASYPRMRAASFRFGEGANWMDRVSGRAPLGPHHVTHRLVPARTEFADARPDVRHAIAENVNYLTDVVRNKRKYYRKMPGYGRPESAGSSVRDTAPGAQESTRQGVTGTC